MTRRQAREQAFVIVFEKTFQPDCSVKDIVSFAEETGLFASDAFALEIANAVWDHVEQIDEKIAPCLKGWKASRISRMANTVLRMAVAEMVYLKDIPFNVTINEAVELAKTYSTPEDASFVNGVLGTISRALKAQQEEEKAARESQLTLDGFGTQE